MIFSNAARRSGSAVSFPSGVRVLFGLEMVPGADNSRIKIFRLHFKKWWWLSPAQSKVVIACYHLTYKVTPMITRHWEVWEWVGTAFPQQDS